MDREREGYAEDFGLLFEGFGLPRMVGRVLGALLVSEEPELSAEALAEALDASRGSISSATRTLVGLGLLQRVSHRGQRRDYFRLKAGAWDEMMRRELESLRSFRRMAERGLSIVEGSGEGSSGATETASRSSLEEMRDFYAYWEKELPAVLERWEESKKRRKKKEEEVSWTQ